MSDNNPTADDNNEEPQQTAELWTLDIHAIIKHPETGEKVELIDFASVDEYMDNVWVCENVETGEYAGTLIDGSAEASDPVVVGVYER